MTEPYRFLILAYDAALHLKERRGTTNLDEAAVIAEGFIKIYPCVIIYEQNKLRLNVERSN